MKNLINNNSWRQGHLDIEANASDFYYVKLARKLYDVIRSSEVGQAEDEFMSYQLAMAATYYFEDVVSGIGIWQTFTSKHKELYGKYLPFYDLSEDDYYQDEVNFEDVRLLLWMVMQKETEHTFLNPENPYLTKMAAMVYKELDAEFEKAPMNVSMLEHLKNGVDYKDFFFVKFLLIRLANNLYLFKPFMDERRDKAENEVRTLMGENLTEESLIYATASIVACCEKIGPLSLYAKDWMAALLFHWGMIEEGERIAAIESLIFSVYLLKNYDSQTVYLENIKGEEYTISRNSFSELPDSTLRDNKTLISSLVKYNGEWQVNGLTSWAAGRQLFDVYKETMAEKEVDTTLYDKIMEVNENHQILYFKDSEEMLKWFDKHIGLHENFTISEKIKKEHFFAVYVDKTKDMSLLPKGALSIKDERNPYYDKKVAEDKSISLIVDAESTTKEMLHYLIEHNMLPDACINSIQGVERGKQLVQENMDFIARFMRMDNY